MFMRYGISAFFLGMGTVLIAPFVSAQATKQSERELMYQRYLDFGAKLSDGGFEPHWMADGSSFWYAEGGPANTVIYKVDPKANTKTPLFDAVRLRKALSLMLGSEPPYQGLPFEKFTFLGGEKTVTFAVDRKEFVLQLDSYSIAFRSEEEKSRLEPRVSSRPPFFPPRSELLSPDGRWFAGLKDYNIYLRSTADGRSTPLTSDGICGYNWDYDSYFEVEARWSPDSHRLAVMKMDSRLVDSVPIVHLLRPREGTDRWVGQKQEVEWQSRRSDVWETNELFVVDIVTTRAVRINTGDEPDQQLLILGWGPDGLELYFLRTDRALKKLELLAADPATGAIRVVLTEAQETFVGGWQLGGANRYAGFYLLQDGKRFLWMSERDGWNHLYLYNTDGSLIRRLTEGEFPLEPGVEAVDEKNGWVYFIAHADRQRPYDTQLYRVSLEGRDFTRLTEGTGQHDVEFSPSKEFFADWHASVERPGTVDLRRADGQFLQTLSRESVDGLTGLKWRPPEEFVVKAADGKTDLYGALYKPYDFDPTKKYPVIDWTQTARCCAMVPQWFDSGAGWLFALAQLGFVTFVVNERGTPGRGKAFQDVAYGNQGRTEILDHVATLKQLSEKRPYIDLNRVGIIGFSRGGFTALRAMLLAPDVFHAGVAMEAPLSQASAGDGDEYRSNRLLAANLKGNLLLIHGTNDHSVPFSETMRMADALIRAGKFFDLIVLPGEDHRSVVYSPYVREAIRHFFQEHLKPE